MVRFDNGGMDMGYTDGQKASNIRYKKECTKAVNLRFFINTDEELALYNRLMQEPNKNGYIKRLIREDMERSEK